MAKLLLASGEVKNIEPLNPNKGFKLPQLYDLLQCQLVELVYLSDGRLMIIDEEGKLTKSLKKSQPIKNHNATALFRKGRLSASEQKEMLRKLYGKCFIDCSPEPDGGMDLDAIYGHAIICKPEEFK